MNPYTVIDIETVGGHPWADHGRDWLVAVGVGSEVYRPDVGRGVARLRLLSPGVVVCHTNYDVRGLMLDGAQLGAGLVFHDTRVMAHLLDSTQSRALDDLADRYLDEQPPKPIKAVGGRIMFQCSLGLVPIEDVPWDEMVAYNASDLAVTGRLYEALRHELVRADQWERFCAEEAPFSRLLVEMEVAGLPIDTELCESVRDRARARAADMREELVRAVGIPDFNPGSGDQVAQYLFGDLLAVKSRIAIPRLNGMAPEAKAEAVEKIAPAGFVVEKIGRDFAHGSFVVDGRGLKSPAIDKHKPEDSRPTVGAKTLKVMHGRDPWVADYLTWKSLDKLVGSFLDVWLVEADNGRLHGRLDQAGTVTGRLASRDPNMQNIPAHGDLDVRQLFRGDLVIGDYGGLEARLSAHFSGDEVMADIFLNGKDLYGTLAARAWDGPESKANEHRPLMKVLVLASQYGARGEKLAQVLAFNGMSYTARQANKFLADMEGAMPRLFQWRHEVIAEAKALGYVTTIAGRRRYLPELGSADWGKMAKAERQAVNSLVQGSAADIVRRAMVACRDRFTPAQAQMLLQVHDEILWERGPEWDDELFPQIVETCETGHGFDLSIPLVFDAKLARSWAEKGGVGLDLSEALA